VIKTARASVGTTAVELSGTDDASSGHYVLATNRAAGSVFLGAADVTAAAGFELAPGETVSADLRPNERLYAIAASGTQAVHVLRTGVE
jgi:hypothetical protein